MLQHYDADDYVDTCEAVSEKAWMGNGYLIIPYINFSLLKGNTVNGNDCLVNYGYYVMEGVHTIMRDSHPSFDTGSGIPDYTDEYIMLANTQLLVVCRRRSLYLPGNVAFSNWPHPFMAYDAPHYQRNLPVEEVATFLKELPETLQTLAGHHACKILL